MSIEGKTVYRPPFTVYRAPSTVNRPIIQDQTIKYQFFATLISRLETEGFTFGTEQYLRWQKMLAQLPTDLSLVELKTLVCPLLAANEVEQTLVYAIYDECLANVEAIHATETKGRGDQRAWWRRLLTWVLLGVGLSIGYWYFSPSANTVKALTEVVEPTYLQLSPNETKSVCIKSNKLGARPAIAKADLLNTTAIDAGLGQYKLEPICLEYTAKDTVGADTFQVQLTDIKGGNWQTTYFVSIRSIPLDTIIRQVLQKKARPVSTPLFATKDLPYPNDIRDLSIPPLTALEKFYQENAKLIKFLLIALFTALLAKILLARDEKRKKLIAAPSEKERVFPLLGLPKAVLSTIKSGEVFFRLLNKFRRRTPDEFYRLNIPKTIAHTIKSAGMVQFKYSLQSRPSEYLLLIDKEKDGHHLGNLFDLIYDYFQENEVLFERFFWDAKVGLCYNEQHTNGLTLEALQHQFYQSKLLFLTARPFTKSTFGIFTKDWKTKFNNWPKGTLLLPIATYTQLSSANKKQNLFSIIPATIEGLNYVLMQDESAGGESIRKSSGEMFVEQPFTEEASTLSVLRKLYSEPVVLWVAATAIYSGLHWNLTLYLGQVIADFKKDTSILSIEHLFDIANLPWFVKGEIPNEQRTELIEFLKEEKPELYTQLTTEIAQLFAGTPPTEGGNAESHKEVIIGLTENISASEEDANKEGNISKSKRTPVIQKLTRKQNILDYIIPNEWRQYLKKIGFPNLGMQDFWKDFLFLMLPLWLLFSGFVWSLPETWDNCNGEIIPYQYEGDLLSLCIDSPQDRVLLQEYYARDAIKVANARAVDSLAETVSKGLDKGIFDAVLSRDESDVAPLRQAVKAFYGNIGSTYYNRGVQLYETSQEKEEDAEAKANSRDEVCYHFDRAVLFDSLDVTLQKAVRWCIKNQIKSVSLQGRVLNKENQQPVANAKITYLGQSTATNATGQFAFSINKKSIAAQRVNLMVRKLDYLGMVDSFGLRQIDRETYAITTPIYLTPEVKEIKKYKLSGTIADEATKKSIQGPVDIFVNGQMEAVGENGKFSFEITNESVKSDQITIKFGHSNYEALTQVLNFNDHTDITLAVTLKALPKEVIGVATAAKVDAAAGVGEITDSLDYLLTTIIETREAFVPFNFETPIPKMELIEGDTFQMGDILGDKAATNETVHTVVVNSFYLGTYEVTLEEFDRFTRAKKRPLCEDNGWGRGQQPVANVSWYEAIQYCNWLSEQHGYEPVYELDTSTSDPSNLSETDTLKWLISPKWEANGYRLPTEAEWEFAARQSGQAIRFGHGLNEANPDFMNFSGKKTTTLAYEAPGVDRTQPLTVGSFAANASNLYDMSGNVREWCWDWLDAYEVIELQIAPKGVIEGVVRVTRGGGFDSPVTQVRTTARVGRTAAEKNGIGLRLCRGVN